jgi:hypothetical protein
MFIVQRFEISKQRGSELALLTTEDTEEGEELKSKERRAKSEEVRAKSEEGRGKR